MTEDALKRNTELVRSRIAHASARAGRSVTVVAATKTVPCDIINVAVALGLTEIGENRVQEYLSKKDGVQCADWHFIGALQRNKAKYLVGNVKLIQSVNSAALAMEIDRLARNRDVVQDVLIEVNAAGETTKTGAAIESLDELVAVVRGLENVRLRGLMSVPPIGAATAVYDRLYGLYARYRNATFDILSVGMSGDYETAIACGSNMVRIGSAIFGARK